VLHLSSFLFPALLAAGVITAGCGYICRDDSACPVTGAEGDLPRALERAAHYLSRKPLRGDHAWFAYQGGLLVGDEFDSWADSLYIDPRHAKGGDGHLAALGRVENLAVAPTWDGVNPQPHVVSYVGAQISREDRESSFKLMGLAAGCDRLDDAEEVEFRDLLRLRSTGYYATAQLWSAVTSFRLGCIDHDALMRHEARLIPRIAAEQEADPGVHDLSVERSAVLAYAGWESGLAPETVAAVAAEQHPVGGWLDPYFDGGAYARPTPLHMSAVAFYLLASAWAAERA